MLVFDESSLRFYGIYLRAVYQEIFKISISDMSLAQVLLFDIIVSQAWSPEYVFESKEGSQCQGEMLAYLQYFASPEFCLVWISINYTDDTQVMSVHMSKEVRNMQTYAVDVIALLMIWWHYIYLLSWGLSI